MWSRRRSTKDFSGEIRAHLEIETGRLRHEGLSAEEARSAARREFGNVTAAEERFYESRRWNWLDRLGQDVRGCFRLWRKRPLAAAAALLTIALGTGMNVALFRVVWNALLKPLPYPGAAQLVQVWRVDPNAGGFGPSDRRLPRAQTFELWRTGSRSFDALASYRPWRVTVGGNGAPERISAGLVSAEFFRVLAVRARFGRTFTAADVDAVVLGHGYWNARFHADQTLVGKRILIDGRFCQVVGVLPAGFRDLVAAGSNVYLPISKIAEGPLKLSSGFVVGRLKRNIGIGS